MEQSEKTTETAKTSQQRQPLRGPLPDGQLQQEDEISLIDLWRIIWPRRKMIIAITFCSALLAVGISLQMPNVYRAELLLAPVGGGESQGGLSAALGNMGGLASMAGISLPGGGVIEETLAVLKSRQFLLKFVADKKLMPILFADAWDPISNKWLETDPQKQPNSWDAFRLLTKQVLSVSQDKKTSLVSLSVQWTDPDLAADWGNELVTRLNEFLRRQAITGSESNLRYLNQALANTRVEEMRQTLFKLIADSQQQAMLANTQEEFALRVLDPASPPDQKAKPKRAMIVVMATMLGGFFAVFLTFFLHWLRGIREQEDGE